MSTLQLLHASDLEGGLDAVANAPNFAAIVDAFEAEAAAEGITSILISGGDNYIPGPFFNAAQFIGDDIFIEVYSALFGEDLAANPDVTVDVGDGRGNVDIAIMNILGFDASAIGNHEFDNGPDAFGGLIAPEVDGDTVESFGALFPYLSTNLDFSDEPALADLAGTEILPASAYQVSPSALVAGEAAPISIAQGTIIGEGEDRVGVVGATTQRVGQISSTGAVEDVTGGQNDMEALAAVMQPVIDAIIADGVDQVVITTHLQDINLEKELATLLEGVDVILAGGSDTILANEGDRLRPGDEAGDSYPVIEIGADGNPVAIVSTDGEYSYVGRLVVEFDENGVIVEESIVEGESAAFPTDDEGVVEVTGAASAEAAIAASGTATLVQTLTDAVQEQVTEADGNVFGDTEVFLDGRRETVRTEEANLGNLTADANLAAAQAADPTVEVALKNGGGIRAAIGEVDGETGELLPTRANPLSGKEEGEVSELDIQNALRFDNSLALVTLSTADLKIVLEHGVSRSGEGSTPGQFPQIGGISFSYDPEGTAQELDENGNVVTEGSRIQNVALIDETGATRQVIVENGEVVEGAPEAIRVTTLNFLVGDEGDLVGGDGYPFQALGEDIAFLTEDGGVTTDFEADNLLGEQRALQDFLAENFPVDGDGAYDQPELPVGSDSRIQILSERSDTVAAPEASDELQIELFQVFRGEFDPEDEDSPEGASEVVSYDDGRLYVTNGNLDRIDIFDIAAGEQVATLDLSDIEGYDGVQSVAAGNGTIVAVVDVEPTDGAPNNGFAAIYDSDTLERVSLVELGNLPDSVSISPDGTSAVVANEGEFNGESDLTVNAPGSISIIDLTDPANATATTVGFDDVDASALRIFPGIDPVLDIEPEFTTYTPDGSLAIVSLQENNGLAVVDVAGREIVGVIDSGRLDHSLSENGFDATDDTTIDIEERSTLGMRMPDAIATYEAQGTLYVLGANEGDGRGDITEADEGVNPEFADEARVEDLLELGLIDESVDTQGLERLTVSTIDGDTDGDGDIDVLHSFGSRSFTIWDTAGNVIFDSGNEFESIIANIAPERFNNDDGEVIGSIDSDGDTVVQNRSDAKGPEPEAIAVGRIGQQDYAFIGLERDSGIMVYNVSEPERSKFVTYLDGFETGNIGPEVIAFIPAEESPTGNAQIAASYEISGTTAVYDLGRLDAAETSEDYYQVALGRSTDIGGFDFWTDILDFGNTERLVADAFDGSAEFQRLIDGLSTEEGIDLVFNNALERDATDDEQAFYAPEVEENGYGELFFDLVNDELLG